MVSMNATAVRNTFSSVIDTVVRERPVFIQRTRDHLMLANLNLIETLTSNCAFTAERYQEGDGSITLTLDQIDIAVNAPSEPEAIMALAGDLHEYALDYYEHYPVWSISPNRKGHLPFIVKVLITDDLKKIGDMITCRAGAS
ncbi:MAG: hypothetical protein FWD25_08545 [Clostridia bacterium]|nr:hypothetical protein [Clostridia bacterium]